MRTVYATVIDIPEVDDAAKAIELVGTWITGWYARHGVSVEQLVAALTSDSMQVEPLPGHRLAVRNLRLAERPEESLIELHWSYPDQYDASLGWRTNLTLLRSRDGLTIALDLAVTGMTFRVAPANIKLGSPRVIRDICRLKSARLGGRPYRSRPEVIRADEVERLTTELVSAERACPVVVVSRRTGTDAALLDAGQLADSIAGLGTVFELADKWAAFRLAEDLGRELSCFDGAIRIYWPGFKLGANPYAHPLWLAKSMGDAASTNRVTRQIAQSIFEAASFRFTEPVSIVSLRHAAEREARSAAWAAAADAQDTDQLLNDLYALQDRLAASERQVEELSKECETMRANAMALASPAVWQQAIGAPSGPSPGSPAAAPGNLKTVRDAVLSAQSTASHLVFTPTAHESAAASPFRQPERVAQALEAIDEVAGIWVKSLATSSAVGSLRKHFKDRGFTYADDISGTSAGKWGDEYRCSFEGEEFDIAPHITLGAKQADTCLSIHWAWDKQRKKALIAHVGRHKTNTKT